MRSQSYRIDRVRRVTICRSRLGGVIGRHRGLKIPRSLIRACGFDSRPRHQLDRFEGDNLIVFNLACAEDHRFEGWFASAEDFDDQSRRALLSCPSCGSVDVRKQLSAPRLNLSGGGADDSAAGATQGVALVKPDQQAQLRELIRQVIESTEDVGQQFPEEARRIHYKEVKPRAIRGMASQDEAKALVEEGIAVAHLPFPVADKSRMN